MNVAHKYDLPRIIIDTNAWITFFCYTAKFDDLNNEARASESADIASRVSALIDGNGKDYDIVMPTVVYAELMGMIRGKGRTPKSRKHLVDVAVDFLESLDFTFIELDEETVLEAQKHVKDFELAGIDAAILASAAYFECQHVYTSDGRMLKVGNSIPGISVELPPEPNTLVYQAPTSKN